MIDALRRLLARVVRWLAAVHAACFPCSVANLNAAQVWFLALPSELSKRLSELVWLWTSAGASRAGQTNDAGSQGCKPRCLDES